MATEMISSVLNRLNAINNGSVLLSTVLENSRVVFSTKKTFKCALHSKIFVHAQYDHVMLKKQY